MGAGYGTQQRKVAEERAEVNAKSEPQKYPLDEAEETDALIPSVDTLDSRKMSASSGDSAASHDEEEAVKERSYLRHPIWWVGITLMTFGEAGNFLAYGFAPASIVSPLGVVALVSNCLVAPLLLHERFRWRDGMGVIIAVAGCVTVVMSASDSNPKLTPSAIWTLITQWEFETYFAITLILIIALCIASNKFGDRSILIDIGLVGLFGGYTALSTKGVASLLSNEVWRVVTFPITYLLVAVLVFTAVMQIKYVNRALQRFNSTMVIPTQFVMFTLSVIVGSAILYRDFERTTTEDAVKFIGGCALTFLGVWFITSGRGDESAGDEEMGEDEDAINLLDEEGIQPEIREREDPAGRRQSLIPGSPSNVGRPQRGDSIPSVAVTPGSNTSEPSSPTRLIGHAPLNPQPFDGAPANAAAIHAHSTSDLSETTPHPGPGAMHATTSAPIVPTLSDARPRTPIKRGITTSAAEGSPTKSTPTTPQPRHSTPGQHLDHNNNISSHKLLNRHSVAGLLPGPLTSPLSSSLSAIVADSLRRGTTPSLRRRSTRLRRKPDLGVDPSPGKPDPSAAPLKRHSIASGEMDFSAPDEDVGSVGARRATLGNARMRSLSATLGDMFGSGSKKARAVEGRENVSSQGRDRQGEEGGG